MTDQLPKIICQRIREGRATVIERKSKRVTIYELEYDQKLYRVAYDEARSRLTTATPIQVVGRA